MSLHEEKTVLPHKYAEGPLGLGDPDDKTLRKVEKEIMIPMKVRERTKAEKCVPEVEAFSQCCKDSGILMTFKCRAANAQLKTCLERWYKDEAFVDECTKQYLDERSYYRRTGIKLKEQKRKEAATF
jgi:COX assembly protein 1